MSVTSGQVISHPHLSSPLRSGVEAYRSKSCPPTLFSSWSLNPCLFLALPVRLCLPSVTTSSSVFNDTRSLNQQKSLLQEVLHCSTLLLYKCLWKCNSGTPLHFWVNPLCVCPFTPHINLHLTWICSSFCFVHSVRSEHSTLKELSKINGCKFKSHFNVWVRVAVFKETGIKRMLFFVGWNDLTDMRFGSLNVPVPFQVKQHSL